MARIRICELNDNNDGTSTSSKYGMTKVLVVEPFPGLLKKQIGAV